MHWNIHQASFRAVSHWLPVVGTKWGGPDIAATITLIVGVLSLYRTTGLHIDMAGPGDFRELVCGEQFTGNSIQDIEEVPSSPSQHDFRQP